MNDKSQLVRHGDISFHPLSELPKNAKLLENVKQYVAAEGETTGHMHTIKSDKKFKVFEYETKNERGELIKEVAYLLTQPATIEHQEHRTTTIPAGIYKQVQEIEEDPFTQAQRFALD